MHGRYLLCCTVRRCGGDKGDHAWRSMTGDCCCCWRHHYSLDDKSFRGSRVSKSRLHLPWQVWFTDRDERDAPRITSKVITPTRPWQALICDVRQWAINLSVWKGRKMLGWDINLCHLQSQQKLDEITAVKVGIVSKQTHIMVRWPFYPGSFIIIKHYWNIHQIKLKMDVKYFIYIRYRNSPSINHTRRTPEIFTSFVTWHGLQLENPPCQRVSKLYGLWPCPWPTTQ